MEKNSWIVVITTLITVGGTIAVAVINRAPAKVEMRVEEPVKPNPPPADPGSGKTEPVVPVTPVKSDAPVTETPAAPPVAPAATVAGPWHDYMHRDYVITVNGNMAQLMGPEFPAGMPAMVSGAGIQWSFTQPNGNAGTCAGTVTGNLLNIMCNSMAGSMPFPLHRPGT